MQDRLVGLWLCAMAFASCGGAPETADSTITCGACVASLRTQPGQLGDNQPSNDLLLQVPGVVQDSFGQLQPRAGQVGHGHHRLIGAEG